MLELSKLQQPKCYDIHYLPTYNIYSILTLSDTSIQNPDICDTMMKPIHASTQEKRFSVKGSEDISPTHPE